MASFGTDFHATLDEIVSLIEGWLERYPIFLSAFAFPPSRQVPITRESIRDVLCRPDITSVVFTMTRVDPSWPSAYDVTMHIEDSLRLNIGRVFPTGLTQSFMSTSHATPTWQKLNRELKKLTTAGAVLDCANGAQGLDRNARFTAGAKALHASGVPLRQFESSTNFVYVPK